METEKVLDYFYYQKLGFDRVDSWQDEDIGQFLVWDFLNAYKNATVGKDILEKYVTSSQKAIAKHRSPFFIDLLDDGLLRFLAFFKKKKRKKILFQNSNYGAIISQARKHFDVGLIIQSRKNRMVMDKDFSGHMDTVLLEGYILDYLKDRRVAHLRALLECVWRRLVKIKPDCIVLGNDLLPVERAIVLAAKKLGITTIEIQHGLYMNPSANSGQGKVPAEPLINGKAADYVLVWGNYTKELYVKAGLRDANDIFVLGYPYVVKKYESTNNKRIIACYLGQGHESYNKDFLPIKLETIKSLVKMCKKADVDFVYRLHPWGEDGAMLGRSLPDVRFTGSEETLAEALSKADIVIGFSSTALVQAAMGGKTALQLMNFPIELDNFEELGACQKSFKTIAELEEYLIGFVKRQPVSTFVFNHNYIETRRSPGERFLEIIEKLSI